MGFAPLNPSYGLTRYAMESSELQHDYSEGWQGLKRRFSG
jgi:homogentisate 1,2-dioxygenase